MGKGCWAFGLEEISEVMQPTPLPLPWLQHGHIETIISNQHSFAPFFLWEESTAFPATPPTFHSSGQYLPRINIIEWLPSAYRSTYHLKSIKRFRFNELIHFPKKYFNNLAIRLIIKGIAETIAITCPKRNQQLFRHFQIPFPFTINMISNLISPRVKIYFMKMCWPKSNLSRLFAVNWDRITVN